MTLDTHESAKIQCFSTGPSGPQVGLWIFEMGLEFSLGYSAPLEKCMAEIPYFIC